MPDLQQLLVIALGLVPGFVASELQSFAALRRNATAFEKTLLAVIYSALLYAVATLGGWGPQFSAAFGRVQSGDTGSLLDASLLVRYLGLLAVAAALGLITGRSLNGGWLRRLLGWLTGRDVSGSAWQQFFHERLGSGFWFDLEDGRRIVGQVVSASDHHGERDVVLRWPRWVSANGRLTAINAPTVLINVDRAKLIAELPAKDLRLKAE